MAQCTCVQHQPALNIIRFLAILYYMVSPAKHCSKGMQLDSSFRARHVLQSVSLPFSRRIYPCGEEWKIAKERALDRSINKEVKLVSYTLMHRASPQNEPWIGSWFSRGWIKMERKKKIDRLIFIFLTTTKYCVQYLWLYVYYSCRQYNLEWLHTERSIQSRGTWHVNYYNIYC